MTEIDPPGFNQLNSAVNLLTLPASLLIVGGCRPYGFRQQKLSADGDGGFADV